MPFNSGSQTTNRLLEITAETVVLTSQFIVTELGLCGKAQMDLHRRSLV